MKKQLQQLRTNHHGFTTDRWALSLMAGLALLGSGGSLSAQVTNYWNGASTTSSNWSDAVNWSGTAIASDNAVSFAGTAKTTNYNDVAGLSLGSVSLAGGLWNISGNPVTLTSSAFTANISGNCNWNLDSTLNTQVSFTQSATADNLYLRGVLSGTGGITKTAGGNGQGVLYLVNTNNSFTGPVNISGTLVAYSLAPGGQNSALGAGASQINIGANNTGYGATFTYAGTNSSTTDRILNFQSLNTGALNFNNNSPSNASLTFNGKVNLTDQTNNYSSPGAVYVTTLGGTSKGTNTFNGPLTTPSNNNNNNWPGTVQISGSGTWVLNNLVSINGTINIAATAHLVLGYTNTFPTANVIFSAMTFAPGGTLDLSAYDQAGTNFVLGTYSGYPQTLTIGHTNNTSTPDINGSLSMAGQATSALTVAGSGLAGTLAINGNLMTANGVINFDLNTNAVSANDVITVTSNLDLSQGTATINLRGLRSTVQTNVPYTLIAYNGTLFGNASGLSVVPPSVIYTATVSTATPNIVTVTFAPSGVPLPVLVWQGGINANWDASTANWLNGGSSAIFANADDVIFNDASSQTSLSLIGQLSVGNLTVSNNVNNYTFTGASGGLADAALLKQGSGSLTLATANTFSEGTVISSGVIQVGNATALGTGTVTLGDTNSGANAAVLGYSSAAVVATPTLISSNSAGPVIIANLNASAIPTLNGAIAMQRGVAFTNANSAANSFLIQGGLSGTGDVTVQGGGGVKLQVASGSSAKFTFAGNIYVTNGAPGATTLCNVNATLSNSTSIYLQGTNTQLGLVNSSPFNALIGNGSVIAGPGAAYVPVLNLGNGNGSGTFSGIVTTNSGGWSPSVVKNGTGTEIFTGDFTGATSGNPTNSGGTTINAGTLAINNAAGTGLNPYGVVVAAAGTLAGNGSISENTNNVAVSGTLSVGNAGDTTGQGFTIISTGALSFNPGGTMRVDLFSGAGAGDNTANPNAADMLNAQTQVTITNASLIVNNPNAMSVWAIGDKWKIANWGSTVTGVFTNLTLPALPSALAWDTSALYSSGVIGIIAPVLPTAPATITGITVSGGNLVITGTNMNGGNSFHYLVLTTTNLATPLTNWLVLTTNSFNANGSFSYTNVINPAQPTLFFSTKAVQ